MGLLMTLRLLICAPAIAALWLAGMVSVATAASSEAFVAQFQSACVPGRLSYKATIANAKAVGWTETTADSHPELKSVFAASDAELKQAIETDWTFKRVAMKRTGGGSGLHLIVTYVEAPDVITLVGCYLYDFDATQPISTAAISAFLGAEVSRMTPVGGGTAKVWGPSKKLPRTLDTYAYHVPEGSDLAKRVGFTGTMMKFETSAIKPDSETAQ